VACVHFKIERQKACPRSRPLGIECIAKAHREPRGARHCLESYELVVREDGMAMESLGI